MVNPCCGVVSLHRRATMMSALTIMRAVCCLLVTSSFLALYLNSKDSILDFLDKYNLDIQFPKLSRDVVLGLTWFMIGVFIFEILLYSVACAAAYRRKMLLLERWFKTKCCLLAIATVFGIVAIIISEDKIIIGVIGILALIYDFYLLWTLKAFAQELRMGREIKAVHK